MIQGSLKKCLLRLTIIGLMVVCCSFSQLVRAEMAKMSPPPTIEDLTEGKVQLGDRIDKANVDLVKDYVTDGVYELIQQGMVMKMGKNPPGEELIPKFFSEATERNQGQAVIDEHMTVYLKDGSTWPGGLPFPDPKDGLEVMSNVKYGATCDDYQLPPFKLNYINKDGKIYKTGKMTTSTLYPTGRLKVPPLGEIPGYEDVMWKSFALFVHPFDLKGMGQLTIRYYDEVAKEDTGFAYLPAFKRIIRVSATTYQDNLGGSDWTWGDPEGIREPLIYWDFKLLETKNMLYPEFKQPAPLLLPDSSPAPTTEFTCGHKFPVSGWAVIPVHVVECTPAIPHIYGKKILYVIAKPYWVMAAQGGIDDIYDRQGRLWKVNPVFWDTVIADGDPYVIGGINPMFDAQTGHSTAQWFQFEVQTGLTPKVFTLEKLIQRGR